MSWNYRIIESIDVDGSPIFALHEVFYDKRGKVQGWGAEAERLDGFESVKELLGALTLMVSDVTPALLRRRTRHSVLKLSELERGGPR